MTLNWPGTISKHFLRLSGALFLGLAYPGSVFATQLHASSEGIITHQVGHIFFLFSMVVLIFTIRDKHLDMEKGWRLIQYSAFFFILWNLDALTAHFLDNQIQVVKTQTLSFDRMLIEVDGGSPALVWTYFFLKMDHLLCVPAMLFLYLGLSRLVKEQRRRQGESP